MKIFFLLILFLSHFATANAFARNPFCNYALRALRQYTQYNFWERPRDVVYFWNTYKSDSQFAGFVDAHKSKKWTTVDFLLKFNDLPDSEKQTYSCPPKIVSIDPQDYRKRVPLFQGEGLLVSQYDEKILFLRPGDTLRFPNLEVKVGEFLGAGNLTMVFAISDKEVIRIPFVSEGLKRDHKFKSIVRVDQLNQAYTKSYLKGAEKLEHITHAQIKAHDPGQRWIRAERIHGSETGQTFYEDNLRLISDYQQLEKKGHAREKIIMTLKTYYPRETDTIEEIISKYDALRNLKSRAEIVLDDVKYFQILWDINNSRWVLLDWVDSTVK